jgi:alpha-beta hydrolase superfamily lysophospholipase
MMALPPEAEDLSGDLEIAIEGVAARERPDSALDVLLRTTRGEIAGVLHPCEGESGAAIFAGGALGGLDGPANAIYARLAEALRRPEMEALRQAQGDPQASSDSLRGLSSLRLHYREPGEFSECVLDVLASISFLKGVGARRVALVGHSFGAAVMVKSGELSDLVAGVAALSPQLYGTRTVERLAPRPLLLVHGTADGVLDYAASKDIYERAQEPKRLVLYDGADHSLASCADELFELLGGWLRDVVGK